MQVEGGTPCRGKLRYEDYYDETGYWVFIECLNCRQRWVKDAA